MKKIHYLFILLLISLVSCDNHKITKHTADVYLYNHLTKTIKIDVFNNEGMISCEVSPNDSVLFRTFEYTIEEGAIYGVYPGELTYNSFVYGVNKVILYYGENKYTYLKEKQDNINDLLSLERYWEVHFDKEKCEKFGWE